MCLTRLASVRLAERHYAVGTALLQNSQNLVYTCDGTVFLVPSARRTRIVTVAAGSASDPLSALWCTLRARGGRALWLKGIKSKGLSPMASESARQTTLIPIGAACSSVTKPNSTGAVSVASPGSKSVETLMSTLTACTCSPSWSFVALRKSALELPSRCFVEARRPSRTNEWRATHG